jgi:hypothetical protein
MKKSFRKHLMVTACAVSISAMTLASSALAGVQTGGYVGDNSALSNIYCMATVDGNNIDYYVRDEGLVAPPVNPSLVFATPTGSVTPDTIPVNFGNAPPYGFIKTGTLTMGPGTTSPLEVSLNINGKLQKILCSVPFGDAGTNPFSLGGAGQTLR